MATVALRDRVQRILASPHGSADERMREAIDQVAEEVDVVTGRLAVIDPEWELLARERIDVPNGKP